MIIVRRFFAVILGLVFLPVALIFLIAFQVNNTLLEPPFYVNQLRQADVYNFLYDRFAPAALAEYKKQANAEVDPAVLEAQVLPVVKETLPPEWLQSTVEQVILKVLPYLTGTTKSFEVNIALKDRVQVLSQAVKRTTREQSTFNLLYDQVLTPQVENLVGPQSHLPYGIEVSGKEVVSALKRVAPPDWLQGQLENALDQTVPYLIGDAQGFRIRVPLKDRVAAVSPALKEVMRKPVAGYPQYPDADRYYRLYREGVVPLVLEAVGKQSIELPVADTVKITVTGQELTSVAKEILEPVPPSWVRGQVEGALDAVVPYLTMEKDTFQVQLALSQVLEVAPQVVERLLKAKLQELYNALPPCTVQQVFDLAQKGLQGMPSCRPGAFTLEQVKQALGISQQNVTWEDLERQAGVSLALLRTGVTFEDIEKTLNVDIAGELRKAIKEALPSVFTYTDVDLRKALNSEQQQGLDDARMWIRDGYTFTETDLRSRLDSSQQSTLDRARDVIAKGAAFTEADLRKVIAQSSSGESLESLDQARSYLGLFKRFAFVDWIVLALFLLAIGFLGGRSLAGRIGWAAVVLLFPAAILFAAAGPVYGAVAEPQIRAQIETSVAHAQPPWGVVAEKGAELGLTVVNSFAGGLALWGLVLLVVALLGIVFAIVWHLTRGRKARTYEAVSDAQAHTSS